MTCVSSLTEENKNYYKITTDLRAKRYFSAEMSSKNLWCNGKETIELCSLPRESNIPHFSLVTT